MIYCIYSISSPGVLIETPMGGVERLGTIKPLSQPGEVSSDYLELPRCKSTVKAICFGLANSANYSDQ